MEELWCWRCEMEIPMLDGEEFGLVMETYGRARAAYDQEVEGWSSGSRFLEVSDTEPEAVDVRYALNKAEQEGMKVVERERERRGLDPEPRLDLEGVLFRKRKRPALEMYRLLTGFEETNINAVWHHRIALRGPPCPQCEKPLRTPRAGYCLECGYGMEEYSDDSRPLAVREGLKGS